MTRSKIGDASFIGLECESGNVDDCNDEPEERAPLKCDGSLILSDKVSKCGSKCTLNPQNDQELSVKESRWTHWISEALDFMHEIEINLVNNFRNSKALKVLTQRNRDQATMKIIMFNLI